MFNIDQDFSQYGEQQIILDFFSREKRPYARYCVDAGAFDGVVGSNSRALLLSGWSGLAIEPNRRSFTRLSQLYAGRPDIRCVQIALSDEKRLGAPMKVSIGPAGVPEADQWMYGQVSTFDSEFARFYEINHAYHYVTEPVDLDTLSSVMQANGVPNDLGFLSIDCEGEDLKILRELDLQRYRPLLICVEADNDPTESGWEGDVCGRGGRAPPVRILAEVIVPCGYKLMAQTTSNSFFEAL